jgi:Rrf2 family protein
MNWSGFMRISSKGRYGLAAMIDLAQTEKLVECVTIVSIADRLNISKIYLEQVFSLLKRSGLVTSVKGAQGGYKLSKAKEKISVGEIMRAIEVGLFEKAELSTHMEQAPIESAIDDLIWKPLDASVINTLESIYLNELVDEAFKNQKGKDFMFYI